jgi:hypothetical protein
MTKNSLKSILLEIFNPTNILAAIGSLFVAFHTFTYILLDAPDYVKIGLSVGLILSGILIDHSLSNRFTLISTSLLLIGGIALWDVQTNLYDYQTNWFIPIFYLTTGVLTNLYLKDRFSIFSTTLLILGLFSTHGVFSISHNESNDIFNIVASLGLCVGLIASSLHFKTILFYYRLNFLPFHYRIHFRFN